MSGAIGGGSPFFSDLGGVGAGALSGAAAGSVVPGLGTVAGAVGGGLSSLIGGIFGSSGQQQANAANAQAVMNQINFQSQQAAQDREFNAQQAGYAMDYGVRSQELQAQYNQKLLGEAQDFNAAQAGIQRDWSGQQAQKQMDFQWSSQQEAERYNQAMSSTAYQRGVADMKAAGINPILAAGQGAASSPSVGALGGAMGSASAASSPGAASVGMPTSGGASFSSVPSGAAARFENPNESLQKGISGAVSSAVEIARLGSELQQISANIDNTHADTLVKNAQTAQSASATNLNNVQSAKVAAELPNIAKMGTFIDADTQSRLATSRAADSSAAASSAQAERTRQETAGYTTYGESWLGKAVQSAVSMLQAFNKLPKAAPTPASANLGGGGPFAPAPSAEDAVIDVSGAH